MAPNDKNPLLINIYECIVYLHDEIIDTIVILPRLINNIYIELFFLKDC